MKQIDLPPPKPTVPSPLSERRRSAWAVVTALTAAVALGVVVPRLVGHGSAHAGIAPLRTASSAAPSVAAASKPASSSATWDSTVPAASDVFVNPESGAVVSAPPPTF